MNIYTVTVLKRDPWRYRTWGYYITVEEAEKAILGNWTDMFEMAYYDLAVVEEVPEGICTLHKVMSWFKADYSDREDDPHVSRIECPDWATQLCNFSFG